MDDFTITLPGEETALLKQEKHSSDWVDKFSSTMNRLFDTEDPSTEQIREIMVSSEVHWGADDPEPDQDGVLDILGSELDSDNLDLVLQSWKQLETFTWFVKMPIPPNILTILQEISPPVTLRYLKVQKTDEANIVPKFDFSTYSSFPNRQYFDRNDFGSMVYTSKQDAQFLRLHLLVPYYPVHEGDAELDWLEKKIAVARSAIDSIQGLSSLYATDYHGDLALLIPSLLEQGSSMRVLKMHTLPSFPFFRPKGPSCLSAPELTLLATHLPSLTHLEFDFNPFPTEADYVTMPFQSPTPSTLALSTFSSVRTLRLWIEVPLVATTFQGNAEKNDCPPLKEDKLVQAVANLYAVLKAANPGLRLEWLEVAFTRLDSWDRQDSYPRFLPVRLRPSGQGPTGVAERKNSQVDDGGFTIEIAEWQDDHPEEDVGKFIDYAVGHIY